MNSKVIIITLNYNQNNYTIKCIDSLLKSDYQNLKILLIDNGSTKNKYSSLKNNLPKNVKLTVKRIEINRGYVGGINYGLETVDKLNPDYFLIMNNDAIIDKNAITQLVKTCHDFNNKAIVTGKVYHYNEPDKLQDIGYTFKNKKTLKINRIGLNEIDNGQYDTIEERDLLDDVFWLFPINLYKQIGGYSPYFWFNAEQADFALRAKKVGYKLIFTPKAKLWHKGSVSIGGRELNPKLAYWHIQSSLILRYLHLSKLNFLIFFINTLNSVVRTTIKAIVLEIISNDSILKYASAKRKGITYFIKWVIRRKTNTGKTPF